MEHKESFNFTYSAAQQQEIESIRKKYLPKEIDKMEQLRKLHHSASQKAQAWAIAVGVIGALIMGTGMSLAMTDIGTALGSLAMILGIAVGIGGMVLIAFAYPLYNHVLKKQREKIAPEVLKISDELPKQER